MFLRWSTSSAADNTWRTLRLCGKKGFMMNEDFWEVAGKRFRSRLLVGTGKYASFDQTARALEASGAEIVTVAVRSVNVSDRSKESLLDYIDRKRYTLLPNTEGYHTAEDA